MEFEITTSSENNRIETSKDIKEFSLKYQAMENFKKDNINNINIVNENIEKKLKSKIKPKKPKLRRYCCRKIGNTLCLLIDKMGNPLIMIGPHWPMYFCFCGFIFYLYSFLFYIDSLDLFFQFFGLFSFYLIFISFTGIFLLNPGYPERNENSLRGNPRDQYKYCIECKIWVRNNMIITHCTECGVCIEGEAIHFAWAGKCIGRKTIFFYHIFLVSIGIGMYFFISFWFYQYFKK